MVLDRRALICTAAIVALCTINPVGAQPHQGFDPVVLAKLRAGEIAREISGSERISSISEPSSDAVFNIGLLLQAGLRALLPVNERQGIALPGSPSQKDPKDLVEAQENYKRVFEANAEATPAQRAIALKSIALATQQLKNVGYASLSQSISDWVETQR